MDTQTYLNQKVAEGNDIVFAEEHQSTSETLALMAETLRQNPHSIQAVTLEMPLVLQPHIDEAAVGQITQEDFRKISRISTAQDHLKEAGIHLSEGRITQEDYDKFETHTLGVIDGVLNGPNDIYTQNSLDSDTEIFGELYALAQVADLNGISIVANDFDRSFIPLIATGNARTPDLIGRMDDTTDVEKLQEQVNLQACGVILAHRGSGHVWDITLDSDQSVTNAGKGMDDYLEQHGRNVIVVGNYASEEALTKNNQATIDLGITISDPSDATIIDGTLHETPDLGIVQHGLPIRL